MRSTWLRLVLVANNLSEDVVRRRTRVACMCETINPKNRKGLCLVEQVENAANRPQHTSWPGLPTPNQYITSSSSILGCFQDRQQLVPSFPSLDMLGWNIRH